MSHVLMDILHSRGFPAERETDVGNVQPRRGHLVEERREAVEVVAVEHHHLVFCLVEAFRKIESCESASDYEYPFHITC